MHVVALGGPGGVGRPAARLAATFPFVSTLTVADRDEAAARAFAAELGVRAEVVDVTDSDRLHAVLSHADVVLNTVGPSFRFGVPILQAAIDARCHYIDVCDDWEPTLAMLDLHPQAQQAGVVAIIGLGASPGVSNLLARLAIDALDSAHTVYTGWDLSAAVPEEGGPSPSAATVHGLHQLTGTVRVMRDGQPTNERPIQRLHLAVPGFGSGPVWTIGHPEAVTLPRTFPSLRTSLNVMHAPHSHVLGIRALAGLIDAGLVDIRRAARWAEALEGTPPDPVKLSEAARNRQRLPPLFAVAQGVLNDRPQTITAAITDMPEGGMGAATGIPLAMGLRVLEGTDRPEPGVWTPEAVVPPGPFLDWVAPYCGRASGQLVELHRS